MATWVIKMTTSKNSWWFNKSLSLDLWSPPTIAHRLSLLGHGIELLLLLLLLTDSCLSLTLLLYFSSSSSGWRTAAELKIRTKCAYGSLPLSIRPWKRLCINCNNRLILTEYNLFHYFTIKDWFRRKEWVFSSLFLFSGFLIWIFSIFYYVRPRDSSLFS